MALENLTGPNVFISNLVRTNPAVDDPVSQGDDHLRGIKNVTLNSFPNITGAVTLTQAQLNEVPTKYAPLDAPAFTGIPTAPTAANGTDTTQLATTEFANNAVAFLSIGVAQTWQNVIGSRVKGATYINDTTRPIQVAIGFVLAAGQSASFTVGGVVVRSVTSAGASWYDGVAGIIVPAGAAYVANGTGSITGWTELR